MIKYVIRECAPQYIGFDFAESFGDFIDGHEDFNKTVFFVPNREYCGYNAEKWEEIANKADNIIDGFMEMGGKYATYDNYKECMEDNDIAYNPHKCRLLKEWVASDPDTRYPETVARFLSIVTGRAWDLTTAKGYCQGDYSVCVFCASEYTKKEIDIFCDYYMGCFREFCVIFLDENGEEEDTVYGYYVTDSEAFRDEEYKKAVCEMERISEDDARLEMIDGETIRTEYTYRVA